MPYDRDTAACRCSMTRFTLTGPPLHSVTCYCASCRTAAQIFDQARLERGGSGRGGSGRGESEGGASAPEPGALPTVTADGGVDYVLYRKDSVRLAENCPPLAEHRLTPGAATRRMVASCCGSPMVLDFTPGHWLSVYSGRLPPPAPAPRLAIMTRDRPPGPPLPAIPPAHPAQPPAFFLTLLAAWAAMGFRRPKLEW